MIDPQDLLDRARSKQQPAAHSKPSFAPVGASGTAPVPNELRRVTIPPHRFTPLRNDWENIMKPIVHHLKLQVRVNPQSRCVEMKVRLLALSKRHGHGNCLLVCFDSRASNRHFVVVVVVIFIC